MKIFSGKNLITLLLSTLGAGAAFGQSIQNLYVPLEIQRAYDRGTRSTTGQPGPKYWQNSSDYDLKVSLDPATGRLTGRATIVYTNNSPDALPQLVLRLYPEILRKDAPRSDRSIDPRDIRDSVVTISRLSVNGVVLSKGDQGAYRRNQPVYLIDGTNLMARLPERLATGQQATLEVAWTYQIPAHTNIREGRYFDTSYMVAYWYPQVAVYDDIDGWDLTDYSGQVEFYNDFNNYKVEVSVPATHMVWATGVWQNPDALLTAPYLSRYKQAREQDPVVKIITEEDRSRGGIMKATGGMHTFRFEAQHVPDFVFAASDTYLWDASSLVVDPKTGRRTTVSAVYHPSSKGFARVCDYARQSVDYFSKTLPAWPFPYPNETIFNGSGGMEFPMFVNDGQFASPQEDAEVTIHEIAHTYFPFMMGINERKYGWMDEGMAQFLPNYKTFMIDGRPFVPQQDNAAGFAFIMSGKEQEVPPMILSKQVNGYQAYAAAVYYRAALASTYLKEMLGDELYLRALHTYMERWQGKHPMPYDYFFTFNEATGQDLSWYWKPWLFEQTSADLGLGAVQTPARGRTRIEVKKVGGLPLPIDLTVKLADGSEQQFHETAAVWKNGKVSFVLEKAFAQPVREIKLGSSRVPDVNPKNNTWTMATDTR